MADEITTTLSKFASGGLDIATILIVLVVAVGIIAALVLLIQNMRKYNQFRCVIWQKDGFGQFQIKSDVAGIFVDKKTNNKRLFLKSHNVGLEPDNIPYLTERKGRKVIYLLQTGLKNFQYIKPVVSDELIYFTVGEEDVNWAVNAYERQKKMFSDNWLMQYLPFMMLAFVSIIILILFMQLFKQMPLLKEITLELKEVALALAQAKSGTTILP